MKKKPESGLDIGRVHRFKKMPNGDIHGYFRVAVADQPLQYLNRDGSIRVEIPDKKALFSGRSRDSLRFITITDNHTMPGDEPNPDNFSRVGAGVAGHLVINDGDYLGVFGAIKKRSLIDAVMSGQRELSLGYTRDLEDRGGRLYQINRDHSELAVVHRGRAGSDCRIKDAADYFHSDFWFDPSQINDDWHKAWSRDSSDEIENQIRRLLDTGSLDPPAVILPAIIPAITTGKKMARIKIGNKTIEVAEESVQDASDLAAEFTALTSAKDSATASLKDAAETAAKLMAAESEVEKLKKSIDETGSTKKDAMTTQLKSLLAAKDELAMFKALHPKADLAKAEIALQDCDLNSYQIEVIKSVQGKTVNKDTAPIWYEAAVSYLNKDEYRVGLSMGAPAMLMMPAEFPNQGMASTNYPALVSGTAPTGMSPGLNYMAETTEANGWYTIS